MSDRLLEIAFGPYSTPNGVYIIAKVMSVDGICDEEIYYNTMEDCLEDLQELLSEGYVDLGYDDDFDTWEEEADWYD